MCGARKKRENAILCLNEQWNEGRRNKNDDDGWEDAEEEDKIFLYFSEEPFYISNHTSNASSNEEEKEEVVDGSRTTLTDILRKRCQTKADCKVGGRCKKTCAQFENSFCERARKHESKWANFRKRKFFAKITITDGLLSHFWNVNSMRKTYWYYLKFCQVVCT